MPPKNNIELGSGKIYFSGLDESIDISDANGYIEFADDKEYIPKISDAKEATFEFDLSPSHEWTLVYCRVCHQPIPITLFKMLTYGPEGWTCPLCTMIERAKRRTVKDCCSEVK